MNKDTLAKETHDDSTKVNKPESKEARAEEKAKKITKKPIQKEIYEEIGGGNENVKQVVINSHNNLFEFEREYKQAMREGETYFLEGGARVSVAVYLDYCYLNLYFPTGQKRNYIRQQMYVGEDQTYETGGFDYKFQILYLSGKITGEANFKINVWKRN